MVVRLEGSLLRNPHFEIAGSQSFYLGRPSAKPSMSVRPKWPSGIGRPDRFFFECAKNRGFEDTVKLSEKRVLIVVDQRRVSHSGARAEGISC